MAWERIYRTKYISVFIQGNTRQVLNLSAIGLVLRNKITRLYLYEKCILDNLLFSSNAPIRDIPHIQVTTTDTQLLLCFDNEELD